MPEYKLTIVATSNGKFLVNSYYKRPDTIVDGIVEVIGFMSKLKLSILRAEPCYQNLRPDDQEIIEGARQTIIRDKLALERTVDSST